MVSTSFASHNYHPLWIKIKAIESPLFPDASTIIIPEDPRLEAFEVSPQYIQQYKPTVGGYYMKYDDGTEFFSQEKE